MKISKHHRFGELVSQNFRTARVSREHQIDFCCGGSRTLKEVFVEKGIDAEGIIASLEAASLEVVMRRTKYNACQTYRVAMLMLDEFEQDLHRHIHLENNILFPGALEYARAL